MNNNVVVMAKEMANRMNIRFHPDLLEQYLHFRYGIWKRAASIYHQQKKQSFDGVLPAERLVEWVTRYNVEFNENGAMA